MFRQTLVHEGDALVTYLARAGIDTPMLVEGRPLMTPGSPIIWFTFPGAWHDIGRCHTPDGAFTGLYANILTPVRIDGDSWDTTDLFLDIAALPDRAPVVLDADELEEATREGWVDAETARRAEREAARLVGAAGAGRWPPAVVHEWTLERVRRVLRAG